MKTKKNRIVNALLLSILIGLSGSMALAQEYPDLEDLQDQNARYYTQIYRIVDEYPDFRYRYVYADGEVVDEEAEPGEGYRTFYNNLYEHLEYPEEAKEWGAEGNVFVKFIVDSDGEIAYITATEDIEASMDKHVNALKEAAKEAVMATSGNWQPARVDGVPVASWAVIPVIFKVEAYPHMPTMIR